MKYRYSPRKWALAAVLICTIGGMMVAAYARARDPGIRLVLNVPDGRLTVYDGDQKIARYRVSVGLGGYETPAGRYRVTYAIWNPWWHPPDSDWARGRKVEPPGPNNPMGRVKMHFSSLFYIHGTPYSSSLGRPSSRGCVRMSNADAIELARLLHKRASPGVTSSELDQLVANSKSTRRIGFSPGIQLHVIYRVAEVRNGFLFILPDVYGLMAGEYEEQVAQVLREHGISLASVDRAKLDRLLRKARTSKVSMDLDTLTTPSSADSPDGGG
jgi:murein L,D-transpeptidase YcbB/YkuD